MNLKNNNKRETIMKMNHAMLIKEIINTNTEEAANVLASVISTEINGLEYKIRNLLEEQKNDKRTIEHLERRVSLEEHKQKMDALRHRLGGE
jgi:DnaJ-domain-containing protein 1